MTNTQIEPQVAADPEPEAEYPYAATEPPQHDKIHHEILIMTPYVARAWMKKHNVNNRNYRRRAAADMRRDIEKGRFDLNGETIKVSRPLKEGEMEGVPAGRVIIVDGQHRIGALAYSEREDISFAVLVVSGLEPEMRQTVDSGARRSLHDILRMDGEVNTTTLASTLKRAILWERGDRKLTANYTPTNAECEEFLEKNGALLRRSAHVAVRMRKEFKDAPQSVIALAYYVLAQVQPQQPNEVPWFFEKLETGADMPYNHPVMALRRRFRRDKDDGKRSVSHQQLAYIFRAWNAYREDRELPHIVQPADANMPVPK